MPLQRKKMGLSQKIRETLLTPKRDCCLNSLVETRNTAPATTDFLLSVADSELSVLHPTGRQQFLIEGKAQQGNLVWFFFWLLGSLK